MNCAKGNRTCDNCAIPAWIRIPNSTEKAVQSQVFKILDGKLFGPNITDQNYIKDTLCNEYQKHYPSRSLTIEIATEKTNGSIIETFECIKKRPIT